jgi:hypothetical protein
VDVGESDPDPVCKYTGCKFLHTTEYLAMKEPDIGKLCEIKSKTAVLTSIVDSETLDPDPSLFVWIRICTRI